MFQTDVFFLIDLFLNAISNVEQIFPDRNRSDGLYYVIDFDLQELRQLRIHERLRLFNGTQVYPLRFPANTSISFQIPTLNETIELIMGLNRATGRLRDLLVEIKRPEYHSQNNKDICAMVVATLNAYNLRESTDPVIIQTFHIDSLSYIRRTLGSRLRLFALMTWNRINESSSDYDFYRSEEGIRNLSRTVQALTPFHELLVTYDSNGTILSVNDFTQWAHRYGLAVYPFTFRQDAFPGNNFEQWIGYFWHVIKVDGFITDHPDVVLQYIQRAIAAENATFNHRNSSSSSRSSMIILFFVVIIMLLKISI